MIFRLLSLHKTLSIIGMFVALLWGGSGMLHPLASWFAHRGAAGVVAPRYLCADGNGMLDGVAQGNRHAPGFARIDIACLEGTSVAFIQAVSGGITATTIDGSDADQLVTSYACRLAALYRNGEKSEIQPNCKSVELVTEFSGSYPEVNRLLPVWRVELDEESYFVDVRSGRLAAINGPFHRALTTGFRSLHTLAFLNSAPQLKLAALLLLQLTFTLLVISGVVLLLFKRKGRRAPLRRRLHRVLGGFMALPLLSLSISGMIHAAAPSLLAPLAVAPQELTAAPNFSWVNITDYQRIAIIPTSTDSPIVVVQNGNVSTCFEENHAPSVDENCARRLVTRTSAGSLKESEPAKLVTKFDHEYGFIWKRLPVWRLPLNDDQGVIFIDVPEGVIAQLLTPASHTEGYVFHIFHKLGALPLGPAGKHIAALIIGLITILLALSGLRLSWR